MSETNLHGVLNMPIGVWGDSYAEKAHRAARYIEASKLIDKLEAELAEAREDSERLRYVCDNEWLVTYTIDEQCDTIYFVYENEKIIGIGDSYQEAIDNAMKGG